MEHGLKKTKESAVRTIMKCFEQIYEDNEFLGLYATLSHLCNLITTLVDLKLVDKKEDVIHDLLLMQETDKVTQCNM